MDIDTNNDGKVTLIEGIAFAQGFLSATFKDVNRLLQTALLIAGTAAALWNATHPTQAVPVPAPIATPVAAPAPADAPAPAASDTDAPKAVGGGS